MEKRGQAASEYLVLGAVALVVALVAVVLISSFTSKGSSEVESRIYWQGAAKPIRIKDAVSLYGSVCDTPSTGGYKLALENSDVDPITLTGVTVDGVDREFCNEGRAPASSMPMGANDQAVVGIPVVEGAAPCHEGQFVSMEIAFIYDKKYLSGHVQNGTKALVFRCSASSVAEGSGGGDAPPTPTCSPSGASCTNLSCCTGFFCNAEIQCQACMRIGERTCRSDSDCCAGVFCTNGMCVGCRFNNAACTANGQCCSANCGGGVCCVDNYHYATNAQCSSDGDCCTGLECNSDRECMPCGNDGAQCIDARDCCAGLVCGAESTCMTCRGSGEICIDSFDCCGGLSCNGEEEKTCGESQPSECVGEGAACCGEYSCPDVESMCCDGLVCGAESTCVNEADCTGTPCDAETPCCEGFACTADVDGTCAVG